ncbi:serine-rich adhesin for platelets isoform X1 [Glossina fuscipes]|uniref:Serine-rich adhesin for platelets isoform X1 n=2 Tax=Glossina fuscipes TaxID=7396 RepID=A0A9C5ZGU2_9MUSC|nr:serine-rich adhesin for platelets isoform X1 [Glossina fuscipes]XP_037894147.1 serine-rich adhesin for platelets isoform X1 [Glossina fuscipes]XP_037894148.1 serine-rich adhesin for platelets isoform X1 [Glossina fuscipes]XP_037894149.1 serine-rich adhesin for platelets isoform X1 [Glossina fuscipes]
MLKNRFSSTSVTNWGRLNVNNATVTAIATITKTFYKASAIPIMRETAITPTSISSMGSSATLSSSSSLFSLLTLRSLSSSFSSATRCFSLFFVLLLLGILSNEGQMVECASAGAVRPGTGNPSARLPRTSASQLNSGNGTGNNVYKLAAKSSTNSTTRNGNLRTREQQLLNIFEVIINTLEGKLKRIDNLDKSVEHMMRRMEMLDNRVSDNLIKTDAVISKLRSLDTKLSNDIVESQQLGNRGLSDASGHVNSARSSPVPPSATSTTSIQLDNRLVLLDQKVTDIDSKLEILKNQIDNNFLQVDEINAEASEKKQITMNVIEITKAMNAEVMSHVSNELNELRDTTGNIDKKLQFHINIVSENVGRMLRMVGDIHDAVVDHHEQLNALNVTTTVLPLIKSSKIDALVKQIRPMVSVSEKMDEVWDVVVGTKSSVDHLLPKSDALLSRTQRQERAIGEIHQDLKTKTNLIINNLDIVERRLKKQEDDVQLLAQRPVPAELLMDPTIDRLVEYDPNRYSVIDDYTETSRTSTLTTAQTTPSTASLAATPTPSSSSIFASFIPSTLTVNTTPTTIVLATYSSSTSLSSSSSSSSSAFNGTNNNITTPYIHNQKHSTTAAGIDTNQNTSSTATIATTNNSISSPSSSSSTSQTATMTSSSPVNSVSQSSSSTSPTKPISRKGGVIFPSVKNKPSVVNTTFSTDIITLKDIKGFSCVDLLNAGMKQSGVFYLQIRGTTYWFLKVFCEQEIAEGGWTVIQRRDDYGEPRENFNRDWADYKNGFGDPAKEFWLGNENIYMLTNNEDYVLRVELEDFEGNKRYAQYSHFKIHSEADYYKLEIDGYEGNAGDSLNDPWYGSNNSPFSTYNRDNDRSSLNCASMLKGGWWWKSCGRGLNGLYLHDPQDLTARQGIVWFRWRGWDYTLKKAIMMIRPRGPQPMNANAS